MKKILLILVAAGFLLTGAAQTRTQEYMKKIPALPKDSCNVTKASAESYISGVSAVRDQLMSEIDEISSKVNSHMESNTSTAEDNAMKQMSQMYGISQADLEKMKNSKNMTAADKQALASKMMSQQANMTMDEAKNLGKMSEAGRQAYAEAYGVEAMAAAETDPNQQAKNENARNMYQSVTSQQAANAKITGITNNIAALYSPILNDPERKKMLDRIDQWNSRIMSMSGIVTASQSKQIDSLSLLIKNEKIAYCNKYTPLQRNALRKHVQILKASLPDYSSYGEMTAATAKAQTGVDMPEEGKELASLEAILNYLDALKAVYAYKLYYPEDN